MPIGRRDIDLNKNALRDFFHIATHIDVFEKIRDVANKVGPQPGITRLAERIEEESHLPTGEIRDLLRGILNLYRSAQFFNASVADFVATLTEAYAAKAVGHDEEERFAIWNKKKDLIRTAVESLHPNDIFLISEKAGRITYAHQNILKDVHLLTDVRPVFDEGATTIVQAIVTHALLVEFFDGTETRRLELTLDAVDLSTLKRLCVRAEKKAIATKEMLKAAPWKTVIFNEWEDSDDSEKKP